MCVCVCVCVCVCLSVNGSVLSCADVPCEVLTAVCSL